MGATATTQTEAPPAEALQLHEAAVVLEESSTSGAIGPDGLITLHVIRPTVGKGRGSHLYTPEMLRENAENFVGWKMYLNHLSPAAKKAAGGLPREWDDFAGQIKEAWWDPDVPADPKNGFERGAVVGKAKPFGLAVKLAAEFPEVLEASISTTATGVRPGKVNGQRVWIVEGIADRGSVDFVTEAGAGGKVISAIQEAMTDTSFTADGLADLPEDQFTEYVTNHRTGLLEALGVETPTHTEEDQVEITPEALTEALTSDEGRKVLDRLVEARVAPIVEAERESIRLQARADTDRELQLRDLRDAAHAAIAESKLHDSLKDNVRGKFTLSEFGPSALLDQFDEVDAQGQVVKSAAAKVEEAVASEIEEATKLAEALAPPRRTRITGQGPSLTVEEAETGKTDKTDNDSADKDKDGRYAGTAAASLLTEARLDPKTAWDGL